MANDPNVTEVDLSGNISFQMKCLDYAAQFKDALAVNTNLTKLNVCCSYLRVPLLVVVFFLGGGVTLSQTFGISLCTLSPIVPIFLATGNQLSNCNLINAAVVDIAEGIAQNASVTGTRGRLSV